MPGLLSILSLFRNKFNEFNNTRPGMLVSIYHMTLKLLCNALFFFFENAKIMPYMRHIGIDVIT